LAPSLHPLEQVPRCTQGWRPVIGGREDGIAGRLAPSRLEAGFGAGL
jgi:hypothetical protein